MTASPTLFDSQRWLLTVMTASQDINQALTLADDALGLARYDGVDEYRPPLGNGPAAQPADIGRAWRLVWRSCALWLLVLSGLALGMEWACR